MSSRVVDELVKHRIPFSGFKIRLNGIELEISEDIAAHG